MLNVMRFALATILCVACQTAVGVEGFEPDKFPVDVRNTDVPQKMRLRHESRKCPSDVGSCGSDTFGLPVDKGPMLITAHADEDQTLCLGAVRTLAKDHKGRHKWDDFESWARSCGTGAVQLCVERAEAFDAVKVFCDDGTPNAQCGTSVKSRPGRYRRLRYTVAYDMPTSCVGHPRTSATTMAKALTIMDAPDADSLDTSNSDDEDEVGGIEDGLIIASGFGEHAGGASSHDSGVASSPGKPVTGITVASRGSADVSRDIDDLSGQQRSLIDGDRGDGGAMRKAGIDDGFTDTLMMRDSAPWGTITGVAVVVAAAMLVVTIRSMRPGQNVLVDKVNGKLPLSPPPRRERGWSRLDEDAAPDAAQAKLGARRKRSVDNVDLVAPASV